MATTKTSKKQATKPKKQAKAKAPPKPKQTEGGDYADHDRVIRVYLDKKLMGTSPTEQDVRVPAGEDANDYARDILDVMIGNELDTGHYEIDESDADLSD